MRSASKSALRTRRRATKTSDRPTDHTTKHKDVATTSETAQQTVQPPGTAVANAGALAVPTALSDDVQGSLTAPPVSAESSPPSDGASGIEPDHARALPSWTTFLFIGLGVLVCMSFVVLFACCWLRRQRNVVRQRKATAAERTIKGPCRHLGDSHFVMQNSTQNSSRDLLVPHHRSEVEHVVPSPRKSSLAGLQTSMPLPTRDLDLSLAALPTPQRHTRPFGSLLTTLNERIDDAAQNAGPQNSTWVMGEALGSPETDNTIFSPHLPDETPLRARHRSTVYLPYTMPPPALEVDDRHDVNRKPLSMLSYYNADRSSPPPSHLHSLR